MTAVSAPTPLLPTSLNTMGALPRTPYSPSFPSELPRSCVKSVSLDEDLKTPVTPPAAYMDFLRSAIIAQTPTSATFSRENITSAPLSAGCTCHHPQRQLTSRTSSSNSVASSKSSKSSTSTTSTTSSTKTANKIAKSSTITITTTTIKTRESAATSEKACCDRAYTFQAPPTPLRTPLSGTKRLRIPASPAFSPGLGSMSFCDSPLPIYASIPRTPIEEEDENSDTLEPAIRSAGGNNPASSSACRHHGMGRKVLLRTSGSSALAKTARMSLMPAPKGKKRRVE